MSKKDSVIIEQLYQKTLEKHPRGVKSYRWWCKAEQYSRFQELLKIAGTLKNLSGNSVLDIGCGRGDLYGYFIKKNVLVRYTGVDIMPQFIDEAKMLYRKAEFIQSPFLEWNTAKRYDYVFASGLISTRISDNEKYMKQSISKMWELTKQGLVFNFLTVFRNDKLQHWYYYDPGKVLNWCVSHLKGVQSLQMSMGYEKSEPVGEATILLRK